MRVLLRCDVYTLLNFLHSFVDEKDERKIRDEEKIRVLSYDSKYNALETYINLSAHTHTHTNIIHLRSQTPNISTC